MFGNRRLRIVEAERDALSRQLRDANDLYVRDQGTIGRLQAQVANLRASQDPDVIDQMAARIAWYEDKLRIVIGGRVSGGGGARLMAGNIRCKRCDRQIEEQHVVAHLLQHATEDAVRPATKEQAKKVRGVRVAVKRVVPRDASRVPLAKKAPARKR